MRIHCVPVIQPVIGLIRLQVGVHARQCKRQRQVIGPELVMPQPAHITMREFIVEGCAEELVQAVKRTCGINRVAIDQQDGGSRISCKAVQAQQVVVVLGQIPLGFASGFCRFGLWVRYQGTVIGKFLQGFVAHIGRAIGFWTGFGAVAEGAPEHFLERFRAVVADQHVVTVRTLLEPGFARKKTIDLAPQVGRQHKRHIAICQ